MLSTECGSGLLLLMIYTTGECLKSGHIFQVALALVVQYQQCLGGAAIPATCKRLSRTVLPLGAALTTIELPSHQLCSTRSRIKKKDDTI
jgi:hypothetical protein